MGQQALGDPVIAQSAFFYDAFVSQPRTAYRFLSGVIVIGNDIAADFFSNLSFYLAKRNAKLYHMFLIRSSTVGFHIFLYA